MKISDQIIANFKKSNIEKIFNISGVNDANDALSEIDSNLDDTYNYNIIINTPYIIVNHHEKDWISFFKRQGIEKKDKDYYDKLYNFLKYPSEIKYWHDYITDRYVVNYTSHIMLTGIPDINSSKSNDFDY